MQTDMKRRFWRTVFILGIIAFLIFVYLNKNALIQRFIPLNLSCKNCNVIVVTIDTLGANHLPCYGYARNTSPNLCDFAKQHVLFLNSYANATWTIPNHVSILTSLYPSTHNVTSFGASLKLSIPFLPEILQERGYKTILTVASQSGAFPPSVYNRGIDATYEEDPSWDEAISAFKTSVAGGKKTFLMLHTFDTHMPFYIGDDPLLYTKDRIPGYPLKDAETDDSSPAYYDYVLAKLRQAIKYQSEDPVTLNKFREMIPLINTYRSDPNLLRTKLDPYHVYYSYLWDNFNFFDKIDTHKPRDIEFVKALYDQKIHQLDENRLQQLFTFLNEKEIKDSTVVVFTADHGEEFMEHGYFRHVTLYDQNNKIPLILSVPGLITPITVSTPVQSVDLMPTILQILGITTPYSFQGTSLIPIIQGQTPKRLLVADGYNQETKVMRSGNWKLFLKRQKDGTYVPYELYDTKKDPGEKTNLFLAHPDIVRNILQEYGSEAAWRSKATGALSQ